MPTVDPILFQAMMTFFALLGFAAWDLRKVEQSIARSERRDRRR